MTRDECVDRVITAINLVCERITTWWMTDAGTLHMSIDGDFTAAELRALADALEPKGDEK